MTRKLTPSAAVPDAAATAPAAARSASRRAHRARSGELLTSSTAVSSVPSSMSVCRLATAKPSGTARGTRYSWQTARRRTGSRWPGTATCRAWPPRAAGRASSYCLARASGPGRRAATPVRALRVHRRRGLVVGVRLARPPAAAGNSPWAAASWSAIPARAHSRDCCPPARRNAATTADSSTGSR